VREHERDRAVKRLQPACARRCAYRLRPGALLRAKRRRKLSSFFFQLTRGNDRKKMRPPKEHSMVAQRMVALLALLRRYLRLARIALLLLLGACGCSRCCSSRWERRLAARIRVHGGAGRAARAPPLDGGTVAYVDGSVAANSAMGAGIFYGVGHPLNRSVRLRQWWSDSRRRDGSNSEEERLLEEGRGDPNLAELGAVYLALLFHPPDLPLTLCTDSLFTLQQLQWLTAQQVRPASYLSMSCRPYCR
jgi:hypothetical protein